MAGWRGSCPGPGLVSGGPDRFVPALSALEAERPFYGPGPQRFDRLGQDGVQERFLALLHRRAPVRTGALSCY